MAWNPNSGRFPVSGTITIQNIRDGFVKAGYTFGTSYSLGDFKGKVLYYNGGSYSVPGSPSDLTQIDLNYFYGRYYLDPSPITIRYSVYSQRYRLITSSMISPPSYRGTPISFTAAIVGAGGGGGGGGHGYDGGPASRSNGGKGGNGGGGYINIYNFTYTNTIFIYGYYGLRGLGGDPGNSGSGGGPTTLQVDYGYFFAGGGQGGGGGGNGYYDGWSVSTRNGGWGADGSGGAGGNGGNGGQWGNPYGWGAPGNPGDYGYINITWNYI